MNDGAQVRVYVSFVGRAVNFTERGELLLLKFAKEIADYGKVDDMPKVEKKGKKGGVKMVINVMPKSLKSKV